MNNISGKGNYLEMYRPLTDKEEISSENVRVILKEEQIKPLIEDYNKLFETSKNLYKIKSIKELYDLLASLDSVKRSIKLIQEIVIVESKEPKL